MRSARRTDLPVAIDGATQWTDSPVENADGLLTLISSQPGIFKELVALASPPQLYGGRPRMPGDWPIAYLLFVAGREPALKRWLVQTDHSLWERCGFSSKPVYDTVHHHFALLEDHADAFRTVASKLIMRGVEASDGLVGRDLHVDGTEAETHARMYHDCQPGERCSRSSRLFGSGPAAKASTPEAQDERHFFARSTPDEEPLIKATQHGHRFQLSSSGCWYRTADPSAGVRTYGGRGQAVKFWVGFNNLKVVDHYTGAVIATETINASVNEHQAYPQLLNKVLENTGQTPRAIVGDRGFSLEPVFEMNTKAGIASVFPWRKHGPNDNRELAGTESYDQHGIPLCKDCGAPGSFESFAAGDRPRLWFECSNGCGRRSVVCSKGWRFLVPLWRTTEAYQALRQSHSNYEKTHWRWRDQWLVGPDSVSNRPRRRGIGCQALRAEAAMLLEWLLVCYQQGWLGGARQNYNSPRTNTAARSVRLLRLSRQRKGLHLPKNLQEEHVRTGVRAPRRT